MAIHFSKISWKNFLSSGDKPVEIQLDKAGTSLIVGINGSGKSTLCDALSFVLFGRPHRNINKAQLINSINDRDCIVEIEFRIGANNYRVVRGYRPHIFEIWQNGKLLNRESTTRDYQKILETNILKLNHKSFHQIVVLGASNFVPFMQLASQNRREVIEDLLDISVFTEMNIVLKERHAKIEDNIDGIDRDIALAKEKITLHSKHLRELQQIDRDNTATLQNEIKDLQSEIAEKEQELVRIQDEYKAKHPAAQSTAAACLKKHTRLKGLESQILSDVASWTTQKAFYEMTDSCPTCQQIIDEKTKTAQIASFAEKLAKWEEAKPLMADGIATASANLAVANAALESLANLTIRVHSYNSAIETLRERIDSISTKMIEASDNVDTSATETALATQRNLRDNLLEKRVVASEQRAYCDVLEALLKDTGIKTKVIRQYLPIINKYINSYLATLDFFVSFTIDEAFNEKIRSRHRDDFSYASFSEGEKARIDLALIFTWRLIAKMKNSAATNLLILDETFDGSIDTDGADNLMKILHTVKGETNVFVITHKRDILEGKFDRTIEFTKIQNFSQIKA